MENTEAKKSKKKALIFIIVLLLAVMAVEGTLLYKKLTYTGASVTAVIQDGTEELNDPDTGNLRISINTDVTVMDDTMQNLNFANYNKNRYLRCRLKYGNDYIYDSGLLGENKVLVGDFVDTDKLEKGDNDIIAEVYSYSLDEEEIGQTNVQLVMNVE
jgi:flagellar basal body-associated protein FliL